MPSSTFENLSPAKKQHVTTALLNEFSRHTLADAQVARIVADAGIARGAFYKYFADLTDAYKYLYRTAIQDIHVPITRTDHLLSAADYVQQVREFVTGINGSPYRDLIRLHFKTNEGLVNRPPVEIKIHSAQEWAVMVLIHETIKGCLLDPANATAALDRLRKVLQKLL
jgi:AcrR family transcriptional regulator